MATATPAVTNLFTCLQQGNVVCFDHLGGYGAAAVKADPNAPTWRTPLNTWARVPSDLAAEWLADFGHPMRCETCGLMVEA